jgi:glycosyltransferase involved in cell wall biosynthesis
MTDIQAAIGLIELERYGENLSRRKEIFKRYDLAFQNEPWAITPKYIDENRETCYHLYLLRIANVSESQRDAIIQEIFEHDVAVNVHFQPLPLLTAYKNLGYSIELRTQFDGTLNSLADFWNKVDVALITSEADAGPSMFMEASLCGVPSISTRIGLPNDVIVDKVNGLFCDRDVADIIDKLKFLIDNKKIHRAMKDNIRATYINRLGVEVQKARWKSLFNAVLNE